MRIKQRLIDGPRGLPFSRDIGTGLAAGFVHEHDDVKWRVTDAGLALERIRQVAASRGYIAILKCLSGRLYREQKELHGQYDCYALPERLKLRGAPMSQAARNN
jgi:hypothetical protein